MRSSKPAPVAHSTAPHIRPAPPLPSEPALPSLGAGTSGPGSRGSPTGNSRVTAWPQLTIATPPRPLCGAQAVLFSAANLADPGCLFLDPHGAFWPLTSSADDTQCVNAALLSVPLTQLAHVVLVAGARVVTAVGAART